MTIRKFYNLNFGRDASEKKKEIKRIIKEKDNAFLEAYTKINLGILDLKNKISDESITNLINKVNNYFEKEEKYFNNSFPGKIGYIKNTFEELMNNVDKITNKDKEWVSKCIREIQLSIKIDNEHYDAYINGNINRGYYIKHRFDKKYNKNAIKVEDAHKKIQEIYNYILDTLKDIYYKDLDKMI